MDVKQAVDVFWFYFGYAELFTLVDDNAAILNGSAADWTLVF
jgi:hypothetical protein